MSDKQKSVKIILNQIKQFFNDSESAFVFRALNGKSYVEFYLNDEKVEFDWDKFTKICELRAEQPDLPIQYLFNKVYFLNLELYIDQRAMIPRFETEELVMKSYQRLRSIKSPDQVKFIIDIGTGSGVIAIALAFLFPKAFILATDISSPALTVAEINVKKFGLQDRIELICSDLFANITNECLADLIISNPPYIPRQEINLLPLNILKYEPRLALDGGEAGFELIAKIINQAPNFLKSDGILALEIDPRHEKLITEIKQPYSQISYADFELDNNNFTRYAFIKYYK